MTPDEYLAKPDWVQRFIAASEQVASEHEEGSGLNG